MAPAEDANKNVRFIQLVESHPCIYNFNLPDYTRKQATDIAWQEVADEMNDSVHNCKERWRNLRTVFVRKMRPSVPDASGKKPISRPYYLTDAMQFLLPFVRVHQGNSNNDSSNKQSSNDSITNKQAPNPIQAIEIKEDIDVDNEDFYELSESSLLAEESDPLECSATVATTSTATTPSIRVSQSVKRKSNVNSGDYAQLEGKKAKVGGSSGDDDARKLFLLSLLPDVYAMSDVQMRKFRKLVVDAIVTVLDETPNGFIGYS